MPISCYFEIVQSAVGFEFDSCKESYIKFLDLYLYLLSHTLHAVYVFTTAYGQC